MNRRNFFSMLAGLPFVGSWIAPPKEEKPDVFRKPAFWIWRHGEGKYQFEEVSIDRDERQKSLEFHVTRLEHEVADLHATLEVIEKNHIEWISVKERLPELSVVPLRFTEEDAKHCDYRWSRELLVIMDGKIHKQLARWTGYLHSGDPDGSWNCFAYIDSHGNAWGMTGITHWAELPAAPQEPS